MADIIDAVQLVSWKAPGMQFKTETRVLNYPIEHNGRTINSVRLTEPDVADLEAIEELGLKEGEPIEPAHVRRLVAILSGLPDEVVAKVNGADIKRLYETVVSLVGGPANLYPPFGCPVIRWTPPRLSLAR